MTNLVRVLSVIGTLLGIAVGVASGATVSGYVRDASNGESLPYVPVFIESPRAGTTTNGFGYYVIPDLPAGRITVACSYIGYERFEGEVTLSEGQNLTLNISLSEVTIEVEATTITAERDESVVMEIPPGRLTLRSSELKSAGRVMLEADPIRTVQTLPGVLSLSDFSVGLYVRGGSPDENLVLLDGSDVYNASHLFGLFSTFPADAAKSTKLLRGGYPAKYGGRLSSVLNVITDEGNKNNFEGIGGVSLLSTRLTLQGPVGRGSWLASGRRTYLEPFLKLAGLDTTFSYSFYDLQGKTHQVISESDQITVAAYAGKDDFGLHHDDIDLGLVWGNTTFSAQWTHIFDPQLFAHFGITGSRFKSESILSAEGFQFKQINDLVDWSFKGDVNMYPSQDHSLEVGWNLKWFSLDFTNLLQGNDWGSIRSDAWDIAAYIQDTWRIGAMLTLQPGLRVSHFTEGAYNQIEPRFAARLRISPNTYLKGAFGIYHQAIFRISREVQGIAILSDIWFPADVTAGPSEAYHYTVGVEHSVGVWSVEWEAYYKDYQDVTAFNYNVDGSSLTAGDFLLRGTGAAYGTDIQIKKSAGRHTGWLSYSLAWTVRRFEDVNFQPGYNEGPFYAFYPKYDRRNQLNLVYQWKWGKKRAGEINARYALASGQGYTVVNGVGSLYDDFGNQAPLTLKGPLNGRRLPMYRRLDVGISYRFRFTSWTITPFVQVVNLLNHENVFNRTVDLDGVPWRQEAGGVDDLTMLPLFPAIGADFDF